MIDLRFDTNESSGDSSDKRSSDKGSSKEGAEFADDMTQQSGANSAIHEIPPFLDWPNWGDALI